MTESAETKEPRVKIGTIRVRELYLSEKFGKEAVEKFRSQASPRLRELILGPDPKDGWIPFDLFVETNLLADKLFGKGDLAMVRDMGRFAAKRNVGAWKAMLTRIMPPAMVMNIAKGLWSSHYDGGRLVTRPLAGKQGLHLGVVDFPKPNRAHCASVMGWMVGTIEAGPRKNVQVREISCRCMGATSCDFELSWD